MTRRAPGGAAATGPVLTGRAGGRAGGGQVSALTNLSFYPGEDSGVWARRAELVAPLGALLFADNAEAVLEAARAFGNLSRDAAVRGAMRGTRVDEALVLLLDSSDRDVLGAAAGVLVNLAADPAGAEALAAGDALLLLADALDREGAGDPALAATLCQAAFNLASTLRWRLDGGSALALARALQNVHDVGAAGAGVLPPELDNVLTRLLHALHARCSEALIEAEEAEAEAAAAAGGGGGTPRAALPAHAYLEPLDERELEQGPGA